MASAETLKKAVFRRVEECRHSLQEGMADLSGLEEGVRAYCDAVAELPKEEGMHHAESLESLMEQMTSLRKELDAAHDTVGRELAALGRVRQANVAYQKSDAIGPVHYKPKEEDE